MPDQPDLKRYMELVDKLVQLTDKEELEECARLLAMTYADELNDQQAELVTKGMETLVGMLGSLIQGLDEKTGH